MKPKFTGWNRIQSLFKKSSGIMVSESPVSTDGTNTHTGTNQTKPTAVKGEIHESNPAKSETPSCKVEKSKNKKTDSVSTSKSGNATRTKSMGSATKSEVRSTSNSTATTTTTCTATVTNAKQASGQLPNLTPVFKFQGNRKKSVAHKKHR